MAFSLVLKSVMAPEAHLWEPDTLKIKLGVDGYELFEPLAKRLQVPYQQTKCLVIARNDEELEGLKRLVEICDLMGIREDVKWLNKEDVLVMEPNITKGVLAVVYEDKWAKTIFPPEYAIANAENARDNGVNFRYGSEVRRIRPLDGAFEISTTEGLICPGRDLS
jgi:L-2-hydroxyglutarate oxidase LhgO